MWKLFFTADITDYAFNFSLPISNPLHVQVYTMKTLFMDGQYIWYINIAFIYMHIFFLQMKKM